MDNLYKLLQDIRPRPELYLGKPSLERLWAFIGGYCYRNELNNCAKNEIDCLDGFQEYVADRYEMYTDHHWSSIIQFFNSNNDKAALDEFYKLFDEFTESKRRAKHITQSFLRSTVAFRMINEKLIPSEITKIFNIVPDVSHEIGHQRAFVDKKGKSTFAMPFSTGMWSIESKQPENETLDSHIMSLLLLLYPFKEKIIELSKNGYKMDMFCGVFSKSCHQPGFDISSDTLKKLGEMNISLSVCFYSFR